MPWHAFTFDGLDGALADAEFAAQVDNAGIPVAVPDSLTTAQGTVTRVNTPLVNSFMETVTPHIQKAVAAGVTDAVTSTQQNMKQKVLIGTIAASGFAVLALAFLWRMSSRLQECCPARPVSGLGCCPSRPMSGCCE